MKYKSVFIQARRGTYEKETFLSGTQTKTSDLYIDGQDLALRCQAACNALHDEGYEVIAINETTNGNFTGMAHGGAGWSMTFGLIITARRMRD